MTNLIPTARLRELLREYDPKHFGESCDWDNSVTDTELFAILSELIRRRCERCDGDGIVSDGCDVVSANADGTPRILSSRPMVPCRECGDLDG